MRKRKISRRFIDTRRNNPKKGFTLIELLVVMGIIAILASVVLIAVNPARQFAQARNSQRMSNVTEILNAIGENMADNNGIFTCNGQPLLPTTSDMKSPGPGGGYDIRSCLVPNYLPEIPFDPSVGSNKSPTDYDTDYSVLQDATTKRISVSAPAAELGQTIVVTR